MQPYLPKLPTLAEDIPEHAKLAITPDQREVALRELREIAFAANLLYKTIEKCAPGEQADRALASTVLKNLEFCLSDLGKTLSVPTQTQSEVEERYAALRAANARIHDMEAEMSARSTHGVAFGIKALEDKFAAWWRTEGFGLVSKTSFHAHGLRAKLSGSLYGRSSLFGGDNPVSGREHRRRWLQSLRKLGFVLQQEREDDDRDAALVDCDASRAALSHLFATALPSCEILEIRSHHLRGRTIMAVRDIVVLVRDLDDITALDVAND